SVVSTMFVLSVGRSDQVMTCSQNLTYMSESAHLRSHMRRPSGQRPLGFWLRASLVNATDLPSPYCQYARIGNVCPLSSVQVIGRPTSGDSRGVVRTKPNRDGTWPMPSVGPGNGVALGWNSFS